MSRFSHYDSDDERLPEGMQRVGYDADTQTYTYEDANGDYWEGPPGCRYGRLRRTPPGPAPLGEQRDMAHQKQASWRQELGPLLNFFLILGLFLLAVFWFMGRATNEAPRSCPEGTWPHSVVQGDTCWAVAEHYHVALEALSGANEGLDCDSMPVGAVLCAPTYIVGATQAPGIETRAAAPPCPSSLH